MQENDVLLEDSYLDFNKGCYLLNLSFYQDFLFKLYNWVLKVQVMIWMKDFLAKYWFSEEKADKSTSFHQNKVA